MNARTSDKPVRAATYRRVSTEGQKDNTSLPEQRRKTREEAEHRGWEVVAEYADEGVSGMTEARPAWQEMLRDAEQGKFDALIVLNTKRFARKSWHAIKEMENLLELGVSLVSLQESFDLSTPAGRAMFGMSAVFANLDRDSIIENTVAGQRAKGQNGQWPGGYPPFGWRLEGQKRTAHPVPDVREREVLREAYRLLVTHRLNAYQVAERLNDAGLGPRLAQVWHPDTLRRILANETLATGILIWGTPSGGQGGLYPRSHKTKVGRDGQPIYGEPIRLELPDPPFSPAEHKAIMRALALRSSRGKTASPVSRPLTGQVFGECGMSYHGVTIKGKTPVMRCSGRKHLRGDAKCACKQVAFDPLEARVWAAVVGFLSDPARLEAMARQYLELPAEVGDGSQDLNMLAVVDRQIAKLEGAQANAARELILADNPAPIRAALTQVERDLAGLRERRDGYRAMASSVQVKGEALRDLAALAERARGNLDQMEAEDRRHVYEILRIRVQMIGAIMVDEQRVAHPDGLRLSGILDPRMWGDEGQGGGSTGGNCNGGPRPLPSFSGPKNLAAGDDGRHGIFCRLGAPVPAQRCSDSAARESDPQPYLPIEPMAPVVRQSP